MKLRNKKTGEIVEFAKGNFISSKDYGFIVYKDDKSGILYRSLAELNEEWEDIPKEEVWYLGGTIGNYSMSKEEARKTTEKILAWKRLKDKGFRFEGWTIDDGLKISICTNFDGDNIYSESEKEIRTNLDLIFGGEE